MFSFGCGSVTPEPIFTTKPSEITLGLIKYPSRPDTLANRQFSGKS